MNELKVFTIEEANRLLPILTRLIMELHQKRDCVSKIEVEIDALELVSDQASDAIPEGLENLIAKHRQSVSEFYEVVDQIHSHGCFLKDIDLGLIDFYGIMEGSVVYLCWRFREKQVGFWHEVGQGYANRQPLV